MLWQKTAKINKINSVKSQFPSEWKLPNVYLLHGEMSEEELNYLYNHPKVKCFISLTHGEGYGRPLQEVKILDGLLIAVNSDVLIKNNLKFDERFSFHLYDVDFSRQAEEKGIKMGTIPMSVIHKSSGGYVSEEWKKSCDVYFKKWNK